MKNNKKGFTLVELLAVIIVLAILATAAFTLVLPRIKESGEKTFATEVSGIVDAAEMYFMEKNVECVMVKTLISDGYLNIKDDASKYQGYVYYKDNKYTAKIAHGDYMTANSSSSTSSSEQTIFDKSHVAKKSGISSTTISRPSTYTTTTCP